MTTKKFRAWDKQDKRLIAHEQDFIPLKVTNIGVFRLDCESESDKWVLLDRDRFILMEGIGRTDMHGVDVYEGDIVTSHVKDTNGKMSVGLISYYDGKLCIVCLSNIHCPAYDNMSDGERLNFLSSSCTVLGNVFEDRELLPISDAEIWTLLGGQYSYSTTPLGERAPVDTSLCCRRP